MDQTQSVISAFSSFPPGELDRVAELLAQLQKVAAELPAEDGNLAEDADFRRRLGLLQIDLLGARALAARAGSNVGLRLALNCRCNQLRTASAEMVISALGYHALPNPLPLLIDNEGPIGHHHALQMMLGLADYFEPSGPELGDYGDRDTIASRIFGDTPSDAESES